MRIYIQKHWSVGDQCDTYNPAQDMVTQEKHVFFQTDFNKLPYPKFIIIFPYYAIYFKFRFVVDYQNSFAK